MSTTVVSHTRLLPLCRGFEVRTSRLLLSSVKPMVLQTDGRPMRQNQWSFWNEVDGWMSWKKARIFNADRRWIPSLSTNLPQRHSVLWKFLAPAVRRTIAIRSSRVQQRCCHFWCFDIKSNVFKKISDVWYFSNKSDVDWAVVYVFHVSSCFFVFHVSCFRINRSYFLSLMCVWFSRCGAGITSDV